MYFSDRGCVRVLRHLYGYATVLTFNGEGIRPIVSLAYTG